MHFSIPETRDVKEVNGSSYVVYSLYINGVLHCNVRYSQLFTLNENLKQILGHESLPYFPPKRFFPLSKSQLEERQYCLQKYLQTVSQHNELVRSPVLRRFLFFTQQKNAGKWLNDNNLTVWLLNGTQVLVKVSYEENSENVLQKVCDNLRVPPELVQYFSLFIQRQSENGETHLIHWLQDYECPLLTMKNLSGQNRIIIRKSYWDSALDMKLMSDRSTLNLLYSQTVSDVEKGWIVTDNDIKEKLATLQSRGAKREYLEIARTLKFYGYIRFNNCTCDYPELGTETVISIGQRDMIFTPKAENMSDKETKFRITKIRCWKITPLNEFNKEVQLSFEYLISAEKLQWITVISEYVYLLSVCLQSIVDELMEKKTGNFSSKASSCKKYFSSSNSSSNPEVALIFNKKSSSKNVQSSNQWKKSKLNEHSYSDSQLHFCPLMENDSFKNIGDDDL